jgi:hypothetical protein
MTHVLPCATILPHARLAFAVSPPGVAPESQAR